MTRPAFRYLVNGRADASLPVDDRGLHYGDGLFETLRVAGGEPEFWPEHMARLQCGCQRLKIRPVDPVLLAGDVRQLCSDQDGVLKIIVTRGAGKRGYRPPVDTEPTRIVLWTPYSPTSSSGIRQGVRVRLCHTRWGRNPALAGIKHLNRLEQVLAQAEWHDPQYFEGLMQDDRGQLISGTKSNVFVIRDEQLCTPALDECGVAGVVRGAVLKLAERMGIPARVTNLTVEDLVAAQGVFLCNSLIGLVPVTVFETHRVKIHDIFVKLFERWEQQRIAMQKERARSDLYRKR